MARKTKKPNVGSHQIDFIGDSNIGKTLELGGGPCHREFEPKVG